jgi:hypothetical protein
MSNSPRFETKAQRDIWRFLRDLNARWVEGRPEDLADFFHEDMVIIAPGFKERIKGRKACVESYKGFSGQASIHDFKEVDPSIDVYGDTAVVSYGFEIIYEMDGETYHETGNDLFVLAHQGDRWRAVWRTLFPFAQDQQEW